MFNLSLLVGAKLTVVINRNDIVHSHIRNMSMASVIPKSRPSIIPSFEIDTVEKEAGRAVMKDDGDLVKERSPLADMLYLRCEWHEVTIRLEGWLLILN
jgi:hypothetical protein